MVKTGSSMVSSTQDKCRTSKTMRTWWTLQSSVKHQDHQETLESDQTQSTMIRLCWTKTAVEAPLRKLTNKNQTLQSLSNESIDRSDKVFYDGNQLSSFFCQWLTHSIDSNLLKKVTRNSKSAIVPNLKIRHPLFGESLLWETQLINFHQVVFPPDPYF